MFSHCEAREPVRDPTPKNVITNRILQPVEVNAMVSRQACVEVSENEGGVDAAVGSREGGREEVLLLGTRSGGFDMEAEYVHAVAIKLK
jgi:hypothetical protein